MAAERCTQVSVCGFHAQTIGPTCKSTSMYPLPDREWSCARTRNWIKHRKVRNCVLARQLQVAVSRGRCAHADNSPGDICCDDSGLFVDMGLPSVNQESLLPKALQSDLAWRWFG